MQKSGKYSIVLVGCTVLNCDRGPWHGEANWQVVKGSLDEWMAKSMDNDPLLKFHGPKIARARGSDPDYITPEFLADVKQKMPEASWF